MLGSILFAGGAVNVGIDPVTLPLTSYILSDQYSAGSIPLITTAGVKATTSFNGPGGALSPTVGASLNGLASMRFTRASSQRLNTGTAITAFITTTAWMYFALYSSVSEQADNGVGTAYDNEALFSDGTNGQFCMAMRQTGPAFQASWYTGTLPYKGSAANFVNGTPNFLQAYYDGTSIFTRVNSGLWTSALSGTGNIGTQTIFIGENYDGTKHINGDMWTMGTGKIVSGTPQADFDGMKAYFNARYALSL